nr:MAG TPA: hypothetical protein [Caudoviricetes sp.]
MFPCNACSPGLPQVYRRLIHVQFLCNFSLRKPCF